MQELKLLPNTNTSEAWLQRAKACMHPVTQTMAKGPGQWLKGVAPVYAKSAEGCYLTDVDGNEYIDFTMAVGPMVLGYNYPKINQAILQQLQEGITFSLMHYSEVEVCEKIQSIIPNAESVRISKTGADVCSAAIRVARAYTQRNKVLCCGYHGWHDWYIGTTSKSAGIPEVTKSLTYTFDYNSIESLRNALDEDVACVIMEPFVFEKPKPGYLEAVVEICKTNGTLLIFDEMWTGFRIALGGAQQYFNVVPDLAVYSKACANGMPIAFLTGRKEIMSLFEHDVFFYTTFGGEALSIAACLATLEELEQKQVPQYLEKLGTKLQNGIKALIEAKNVQKWFSIGGYPCRSIFNIDPSAGNVLLLKSIAQQEFLRHRILWQGFHNLSFSHTEKEIEITLAAYQQVIEVLIEAIESGSPEKYLLGEPLEPVFRKVNQFNTKPVAK